MSDPADLGIQPSRNYACTSFGNGQTCVQTATNSVLTAQCSGGSFVSSAYATFPLAATTTDTDSNVLVSSVTRLAVAAPMIQINWRSEDLASTSSSQTTSVTTSGSPSSGSLPTETQPGSSLAPSDASQGSSSSSSISPGALAGAVIGGVAGLFAIAAAIFFFLRKRKTRGKIDDEFLIQPQMNKQKGPREGVTELPVNQRAVELQGSRDPSELSGYQRPLELPAS